MLKIDVIKFETQDVITTSIPGTASCICNADCWDSYSSCYNHVGCKGKCEFDTHPNAGPRT